MRQSIKVALLFETARAYERALLRGIARYSISHGSCMFYKKSPYLTRAGSTDRICRWIKKCGVDGIIVRDIDHFDKILALGLPTIAAPYKGSYDPHILAIRGDCHADGALAAAHLLDKGFQNFGYCGIDELEWSHERFEGFQERVRREGFEPYNYKRSRKKMSEEEEIHDIASWLKKLPTPIGIMTCVDERSQQVVEACTVADIYIPNEVAIIGVDNDEYICNLTNPPLSSVALSVEKAGYEAAEILERMIKGRPVSHQDIIVSPTHVVGRQSTDIMAVKDKDVAKALNYIKQNARDIIQVDDVVRAASLSRRSLERKFRLTLNRSILDEIRAARVNQIARLLIETDMTISDISVKLNFQRIENVSRYFKREKAMTPQEFRKRYAQR